MTDSRRVMVWTNDWLPQSETFVRNQADMLPTWTSVCAGAWAVESTLRRPADRVVFARPKNRWHKLLQPVFGGRQITRLLRESKVDVVHAHFAYSAISIISAARRAKIPLIVTLHGVDITALPRRSGVRGLLYRRRLRQLFAYATTVLAVSDYIGEQAVQFGADPSRMETHHIGIPILGALKSVERRWDILFVGRLVEKKGVDDLLEAVSKLEGAAQLKIAIVGTGPQKLDLEHQARRLNLSVTFLGAMDSVRVRETMAASLMLVAASKTAANGDSEGLPIVILEAMDAGLPVIATSHSGIPEAVTHRVSGLLSAEKNATELATHLAELLSDEQLRHRLGMQGQAVVGSQFDILQQTALLETIYERTVSTFAAKQL